MTTKKRFPKRALVFAGTGTTDGTRITIKASSGQPFSHPYWDKLAIDLTGMEVPKPTLPILMSHDLSRPIGSFHREDVLVNGGLTVHGQLADVTAAKEFVRQIKGGIPFEASFYGVPSRIERVEEGGKTEVNGVSFEGPGSIWRQWALREVSPCIFGADSATSTNVFSFADAEKMVDVELDGESEDEIEAEKLFRLSMGINPEVEDDTSAEDQKLAEQIFQSASGGQV